MRDAEDYALMARVFDGGTGDCPGLLEAIQAHTRQIGLEHHRRAREMIDGGIVMGDIELSQIGDKVSAIVKERVRLARIQHGD